MFLLRWICLERKDFSLAWIHFEWGTCIFLYWHFCVRTFKSSCSSEVILLLFAPGLNCTVQNVGPAGSSSCQMDHRQSYRDQDAQNCQSESHKAGAEHLPAQGEPLNTQK